MKKYSIMPGVILLMQLFASGVNGQVPSAQAQDALRPNPQIRQRIIYPES